MAENRGPDNVDTPPGDAWHEIWLKVLANPSDATFRDVLSGPRVSTVRALRWVFVSYLAAMGLIIAYIVLVLGGGGILENLLQLVIAVGLGGFVAVVGFVVTSLFLQGFARLAGGEGSFEQFHYAYAASYAPLLVINTLVMLAGGTPIFGIVLGLYQLVLVGMALRAVNGFSWGRTVVTILAVMGVFTPLLMAALAFLAAVLSAMI